MAESEQQTETLSLRISAALRSRLERIRELSSRRKGESVSSSEIAKRLRATVSACLGSTIITG